MEKKLEKAQTKSNKSMDVNTEIMGKKLEKARNCRKNGFYQKAIFHYGNALQESLKISNNKMTKQVLEIRLDIALSYFEQGRYEKTLALYGSIVQEIESNDPTFPNKTIFLNGALIQIAMVYVIQGNIIDASKYCSKIHSILNKYVYKEDIYEKEKRTQAVQYKSIEASIYRLKKAWVKATEKYKSVVKACNAIRIKFPSIGANQRYAKANFNLSRCAAETNDLDLMISSIKEAQRISYKYLTPNHPESCRYSIEYARTLRIKAKNLTDKGEEPKELIVAARKELSDLCDQHEKLLKDEKFIKSLAAADLLEHQYLLKELSSVDLQLSHLESIGVRYERNANLVHKFLPYLALAFLNKALYFFDKTPEHSGSLIACKRILSSKAAILSGLAVPDPTEAMIAAKKSCQYLDNDHDSKDLAIHKKNWRSFFQNWRLEWIVQWNWCVKEYNEFQKSWHNDQFEQDDIFHQRNAQLIITPKDRVKLMMILSRLKMLMDQVYLYCIEKKSYKPIGKSKNLYFPVAHTKSHLNSMWKKQGVEMLMSKPHMSDIRQTIVEMQPFNSSSAKSNWLFTLNTITNFSKHSHIGVQSIPEQSITKKKGLIQKRFQDMEIGLCRTNRIIYPHMLAHMFPHHNEVSIFAFLSDSSLQLLHVQKSFDWYGKLNMQLKPVQDYIKAIRDENGTNKAIKAYQNYFKIITKAFATSNIQDKDLHRITEYLLNLAAQSEGLALTSDKIELTSFIQNTFLGVAKLLNSAAKINKKSSEFELVNILRDVHKTPNCENIVTGFSLSLKRYASSRSLDDLRILDEYARQIARMYLISGETSKTIKHWNELLFKVPYWLADDYGHLSRTQLGLNIEEIKTSTVTNHLSWALVDDDIAARLVSVEQMIFYKSPLNLFRHGSRARYNFANELVNTYTLIHYILDQTWMRLYDRVYRVSSGIIIKYPANIKLARDIITKLQDKTSAPNLPTTLKDNILSSMSWWEGFRITALELKHSSIDKILRISKNVLRDGNVSALDIKSENYQSQTTKNKIIKCMCELRNAFDFTANFVLDAFKFINKNKASGTCFNHMMKLEQFQRVVGSDFYSDAALVQSAQESFQQNANFSSFISMPESKTDGNYKEDFGKAGKQL